VNAGLARCARCGDRIIPGTPWDVGHVDGTGRTVVSGPEHRLSKDCPKGGNRATARHRKERFWSRDW